MPHQKHELEKNTAEGVERGFWEGFSPLAGWTGPDTPCWEPRTRCLGPRASPPLPCPVCFKKQSLKPQRSFSCCPCFAAARKLLPVPGGGWSSATTPLPPLFGRGHRSHPPVAVPGGSSRAQLRPLQLQNRNPPSISGDSSPGLAPSGESAEAEQNALALFPQQPASRRKYY